MPDPVDPEAAGGGETETPNSPEVKSLIDNAVKEATSGLAKNRDEVLAEKKQLQEQFQQLQEQWKGLDPEQVRTIMQRLEGDEETKLLAEGKTDEVIERRTQRLKADYEKQIQSASEKAQTLEQAVTERDERIKGLMIEGSLRQAASELGVVPSAVEDALTRAKTVFNFDEEGNLVATENGTTMYGKDGKTPISPAEWLETMKEKAPHWFPAPSGGGASGGGRGRGGAMTIARSQARDAVAYRTAKERADKAGVPLQIVDDTAA